ncbi:uncharacterized protein LOC143984348 [Lithobates pipiens]
MLRRKDLEFFYEDEIQESLSKEEAVESLSLEVAVESSLTKSQVPPLRLPTKRTRKVRNLEESVTTLINQATAVLTTSPVGPESNGCLTASKLEQIEEGQRLICEEIILQDLKKEMRGQLTTKSHLCELDNTPPPPPETPPPPPATPPPPPATPPTTQPPNPPQQHGSEHGRMC